jgi:hypothetical protein
MRTIFHDLDRGELFQWQGDIYRFDSIDAKGIGHATRIMTIAAGIPVSCGPNLGDHWNIYCEVETGFLRVEWVPHYAPDGYVA